MNTLIIPCAGKSSRFPNMKPKYLLTHPDGKLMIEKALEGINLDIFERIIITIVKAHDAACNAALILRQVFANNPKIEICILENFTTSACETIYQTLTRMQVQGAFVIKDADNRVELSLPLSLKNAVAGYDVSLHKDVPNIPEKSFLVINEQDILQDIIEKHIVSDKICIGIYCFESTKEFIATYHEMINFTIKGEMYISHIISYLLRDKKHIFTVYWAKSYNDYGTLAEWKKEQQKYRTYFVDVDGVIVKNSGKYGQLNWSNNSSYLEENIKLLQKLAAEGAQIVVTTSRSEEYRAELEALLARAGLQPHALVLGLHHAARVIINDFAPTNPFPSALAVSLPRNSSLQPYIG